MRTGWGATLLTSILLSGWPVVAGTMPTAEQNALVQKYCAVCHSDALMVGGFSLQHFDTAQADPSLAAMLVSKLTGGLSLSQAAAARADPAAAALVATSMKTGAMGAAGLGVPDRQTQDALVGALSAEAAHATEWTVMHTPDPKTQAPMVTAGILRESPSSTKAGITDMYRLLLTCHPATHEAQMQLAWADAVPEEGHPFSVVIDGLTPMTYKTEGGAKQGNGKYGPGSLILYATGENLDAMPLPARTLTVSDVFPGATVVFPFDALTQAVRKDLSACFAESDTVRTAKVR
jgi:hypothetical protein